MIAILFCRNRFLRTLGILALLSCETLLTSLALADEDANRIRSLAAQVVRLGDADQGWAVFQDERFACLSCHQIGRHGGSIGPDLSDIGRQRTLPEIIDSVFQPSKTIAPEYQCWTVDLADGKQMKGYLRSADSPQEIQLLDPASQRITIIRQEIIDAKIATGTLMPDGLAQALTYRQQLDLFRFLSERDRSKQDANDFVLSPQTPHEHIAEFAYETAPLHLNHHHLAAHPVNARRVYDYYAKQAEEFRNRTTLPRLLPAFPGLDGGEFGHWGQQNETTWSDDRWNQTDLGSVQAGIFRTETLEVARAICVSLGNESNLFGCFDIDTGRYVAMWRDHLVKFSSFRHGFLHGLQPDGPLWDTANWQPQLKLRNENTAYKYEGYYRWGTKTIFAYSLDGVPYLDSLTFENGQLIHEVKPADQHSQRRCLQGGERQWKETLTTEIQLGQQTPFAVDTIEVPFQNPWNALMFFGGLDFLSDGSAMVCTIQGDVWHVTGFQQSLSADSVSWQRFASGLHHPLGLVVKDDHVFVMCRDQLLHLVDLNSDGEADYYDCFSNTFVTSTAGHDFICGLQVDSQGRFYTASGNQGVLRFSNDGTQVEVLATGFRNPDGLSLSPDGWVSVPCSEGEWTPASMICEFPLDTNKPQPFFGYRGPKDGQAPALPLAYLPRGVDNSSAEQVTVTSDRWKPLFDKTIHLSFGAGNVFLLLTDHVGDRRQGAIVPLPGDFASGIHRARFHPRDGQLYLVGMQGWLSFTPDDGCFQRYRFTGQPLALPTDFHVYQNGVMVTFAKAVTPDVVADSQNHFAQAWNYRYSAAYGSPEMSPTHPHTVGHDPLLIQSTHVMPDQRSVFYAIPDLQPVSMLHLYTQVHSDSIPQELFVTVHAMDSPFTDLPNYVAVEKLIAAHPLTVDMANLTPPQPNPWQQPIENARQIRIQVGPNLQYVQKEIRTRPNEPLHLILENPDVVPHNWVLAESGTLQAVGQMTNQLVADPQAAIRQYVPSSRAILVYTNIVQPKSEFEIYFRSPQEPGRYPFLCTFPGHWTIMNGEMIVERLPAN